MVEILKTMLSTAMEALDKHDGAAALKVFPTTTTWTTSTSR